MTEDSELLKFVVGKLVDYPDDIDIVRSIDEKGVLLQLTVHADDLGRVIGKQGATANAIRTLLRALGAKNNARYNFKVIDNAKETE